MTGLVFAFAGYLVHDVRHVVPFMLLDSIEAIDSDRIADLVEHFEQYADYLVLELLNDPNLGIKIDEEANLRVRQRLRARKPRC